MKRQRHSYHYGYRQNGRINPQKRATRTRSERSYDVPRRRRVNFKKSMMSALSQQMTSKDDTT
jgi:hypothetical protein